MLNILMVTLAYYPEYSGAAKQCHTLSIELIKKGLNVNVITFTNNKNLTKNECIDGVNINRIYVKNNVISSIITCFKFIKTLVLHCNAANVIHVHGYINHLLWLTWYGILLNKKVIMKITMAGIDTPNAILKKSILHRLSYKKIHKIIATTQQMLQEFDNHLDIKHKAIKIPNGVNTGRFHPIEKSGIINLKATLGLPVKKEYILFNGIISKRKGIDILFEAWQNLKAKLGESCPCLLIVGPFESDVWSKLIGKDKLKEYTESLKKNYPNDLYYVGMTKDVQNYYKISSYFVLASRNEGLPNALLEALATGVPSIVSNFKGANEIINHKNNGLILKDHTPKELENNLYKIITDRHSRNQFSKYSLNLIKTTYSIETIVNAYIRLYKNIIK